MLVLNTDEKEGKWFDYPGKAGVRVKLRGLPKKEMRVLRAKAMKRVKKQNEYNKMVWVDEPDPDLFDALMFGAAILDWDGIVEPSGQKASINKENIALAMNIFYDFSHFCSDKIFSFSEEIESDQEDLLKNLNPLVGGSGPGQRE